MARYSRWLDQLLEVALIGADAAEFCRQIAAELPEARGPASRPGSLSPG